MPARVVGVILAGGLSRRMGGGDKTLRLVGGRSILDRVIERLRPQVSRVVLNANGDPERFAANGLPVVADTVPGFPGPLAGVLAGLDWVAAEMPEAVWIVTVAADVPFLPFDLVSRLVHAAEQGAELVSAASRGQTHPVIGLWPIGLREDLRRALVREGAHSVSGWTASRRLAIVDFPAVSVDPFFNVNTPEDLTAAERLLVP